MKPRWLGPYKVLDCLGKGVVKIANLKTGVTLKKAVNVCRLKRYFSDADDFSRTSANAFELDCGESDSNASSDLSDLSNPDQPLSPNLQQHDSDTSDEVLSMPSDHGHPQQCSTPRKGTAQKTVRFYLV